MTVAKLWKDTLIQVGYKHLSMYNGVLFLCLTIIGGIHMDISIFASGTMLYAMTTVTGHFTHPSGFNSLTNP